MTEPRYFGFGGENPTPARPTALALADALFELTEARAGLERKKERVPDYTGQWDSKDYYAEEQERYNRAADNFELFVQSIAILNLVKQNG